MDTKKLKLLGAGAVILGAGAVAAMNGMRSKPTESTVGLLIEASRPFTMTRVMPTLEPKAAAATVAASRRL